MNEIAHRRTCAAGSGQIENTGGVSASFTEIPTLDLARWTQVDDPQERDRFADELLRIGHEAGFLLLVGHGVEQAWIDRYFAALEAFFALPEQTKAKIDKVASAQFRGWERVGAELTNNRVDFREQLDLCTENPIRPRADDQTTYLRLDGPNQWLDETDLPGFRDLVVEFMVTMGEIAGQLMAALCRGLGLPDDHLDAVFGERPFSLAKLIRYPASPVGEFGATPTTMRALSPCCSNMASAASRRSTPKVTGSTCPRLPARSSSTSARCCKR